MDGRVYCWQTHADGCIDDLQAVKCVSLNNRENDWTDRAWGPCSGSRLHEINHMYMHLICFDNKSSNSIILQRYRLSKQNMSAVVCMTRDHQSNYLNADTAVECVALCVSIARPITNSLSLPHCAHAYSIYYRRIWSLYFFRAGLPSVWQSVWLCTVHHVIWFRHCTVAHNWM